MASPVDPTKIRVGAVVMVPMVVDSLVDSEGKFAARVYPTGPLCTLPADRIADVRSQPFRPQDLIRVYPSNGNGTYYCGHYVHDLRQGQALVRKFDGELKIAFVSELHHENPKDPQA